jgi:hypothetical protein
MDILNAWEPFLISIGSLIAAWRFGLVYEARERWTFLDTLMVIAFAAALATLLVMDVRQGLIITPGDLLGRSLRHAFDAAGVAGVPAGLALLTEGYKRRPRQPRTEARTARSPDESLSRERADPNDPDFDLDPERFAQRSRKNGRGRRPSNDN